MGRAKGRGMLRRVRVGGQWVYRGEWRDAQGRRHRRILATRSADAERALAAIIRDRDMALAGTRAETGQTERELDGLVAAYLADYATRRAASTVERTRGILERLPRELRARRVGDLDTEAVLDWRRRRVLGGASHRTANKELGTLRAMLRWAVRHRLIACSPIGDLEPLPEGRAHQTYARRALTELEVAALVQASRDHDEAQDARARAERTVRGASKGQGYATRRRKPRVPQTPLWLFLLLTGSRWAEAAALTWSDVDVEAGVVRFRASTTKTRRERLAPLVPELADELRELKALHGRRRRRVPRPDERVFLAPKGEEWRERRNAVRRLRSLAERAGIPVRTAEGQLDLHALRHTFGTRVARAAGLAESQRLMGHSDPKITAEFYVHLQVEDLRRALAQVPRIPGAKWAGGQSVDDVASGPSDASSDDDGGCDGARGGNRTRNPCFTKATPVDLGRVVTAWHTHGSYVDRAWRTRERRFSPPGAGIGPVGIVSADSESGRFRALSGHLPGYGLTYPEVAAA